MDESAISNMNDYYIVCSLSFGFGLFSVIISMIIVIIIKRSKTQLHTVRHLLISNTCTASIVYCVAQTANYIVLIFFPLITSDIACRWRGYVGYMSISAAIYSYLIQAISRLFFSVFSTRHPWLTTFKTHRILIGIHWLSAIIIALPSVITDDIYFRPGLLCWVPMRSFIHVIYTLLAYYVAPILGILIIYVYIYRHIQRVKKQTQLIRNTTSQKRDLEVLRNIVILLSIYISGGIPTLFYLLTSIDFLYLLGIVTFAAVVMIEKLCTIGLDRELRIVVKSTISSKDRIMPFGNSITQLGYHENTTGLQRVGATKPYLTAKV